MAAPKRSNVEALLTRVEQSQVGYRSTLQGPFGTRRVIYTDYTASGKALSFIEDYISSEVLPIYGNTHTSTSHTSRQTTQYREEARMILRNAVNASEKDAVMFAGSGCTGAVHKLISCLDLASLPKPPVVFVSPFEHHSNLLPWREIGAEVVWIAEDWNGMANVADLENKLKTYVGCGRKLIGSLNAASNITGVLTDVNLFSAVLHRYGALVFWDYATAAPYVKIDMNPVVVSANKDLVYKDAVFFSAHKFVGGVDSPGVLVAKKHLLTNTTPGHCGGGTVFFVTPSSHRYFKEVEMREEGGTPAIVGSIRAGLAMQLKEAVGSDRIMALEEEITRFVLSEWESVPELIVVGPHSIPRLPVFSFLIRHLASGQFLHPNFVCALMNDLFGIQVRGGCSCAGPYAQSLLGIDEELAKRYEALVMEDSRLDRTHLRRYQEYSEREVLRPGVTRLSFPYFMHKEAVEFVTKAVAMVARNGWKLLPQYLFNPETGLFRHHQYHVAKERRWLGAISYETGEMVYPPTKEREALGFEETLIYAETVFKTASQQPKAQLSDQSLFLAEGAEQLRWFLLPSEAQSCLLCQPLPQASLPFTPKHYPLELRTSRNEERGGETATCKETESDKTSNLMMTRGPLADTVSGPQLAGEVGSAVATDSDALEGSSFVGRESVRQLSASSDPGKGRQPNSGSRGRQEEEEDVPAGEFDESVVEESRQFSPGSALGEVGEAQVTSVGATPPVEPADEVGRPKFHCPPKKIYKPTVEAIDEYGMIENGDCVLVCLSGGKDSLSLLHTLHQYQFVARSKGVDFRLGAVTVDPQTSSYNPRPLVPYLAALGVPYFYEEQGILQQAISLPECASICSFCSRMKRGRLYACARREGYNVLAMGQHLDDLAESFLMSVFHNGLLRTMKANYTVEEGDLRVIRPLVYVREKDLRDFADKAKLPVIAENCPACFEAPKERHRVKQLLAAQELLFPRLFQSLQTAMRPLMARNKTGLEGRKISKDRHDDGDLL